MKRFVDFLISEATVSTAILLNAGALFVLGFIPSEDTLARALARLDYACVVYFVLEATLKIKRAGWRGYWGKGWNRFDFTIVLLSTPALLTPVVDLQGFGVFLVLRLGRLFRLFRLMRFIPNHRHLAAGIARALRASVGVFLALLLINVILAMGATYLFGDIAPDYFGNPLLSCYSLFKVFTVEGWHEIPDHLVQRTQTPGWAVVVRLYFIGCVLIGGILGLSLANAVFVDEMMMDNTDVLEAKVDALQEEIQALRAEIQRATGDRS